MPPMIWLVGVAPIWTRLKNTTPGTFSFQPSGIPVALRRQRLWFGWLGPSDSGAQGQSANSLPLLYRAYHPTDSLLLLSLPAAELGEGGP